MEHQNTDPLDAGASFGSPGPGVLPVAEPAGPLSEEQFILIRQAIAARRPVRKAARVAHGSAITILIVAAGSVPVLLFSFSMSGLVVAVAIGTVGYLEYVGARKMARGLPEAASHLGWNQAVFIALIVMYCINAMLEATSSSTAMSAELKGQLSQLGGMAKDIDSMISGVTYAIYTLVILVSTVAQGALAFYYFSRRHYLEALQQTTPAWIRRLLDELAT